MQQLAPLPAHLRLPLDWELKVAQEGMGAEFPRIGWREEDCTVCQGTKIGRTWSGAPSQTEVVEFECNCIEQMILSRYLGVRGIPLVMRTKGGADLFWVKQGTKDDIKNWKTCPEEMLHRTTGLILTGDSGKTLIASLIQRWLIHAGIDGFMLVRQMFSPDFALFNWKSEWHEQMRELWVRNIRPAPVLIIDHLEGKFGVQDRIITTIDDLLRYRFDNGLLTIITSKSAKDAHNVVPGIAELINQFDTVNVVSSTYPQAEINRQEWERKIVRPVVLG